mgnify:CR=1 FL=1
MSELTKRVLFALVAAPIFIGLIVVGGIYLWILLVLISILTAKEIADLFTAVGYKTRLIPVILLSVAAMGITFNGASLIGFTFLIFLVIIKETLNATHDRYLSILTTIYAAVYPAWGFYSFYELRNWESDTTGLTLVLMVLVMIWGNDSFAYFVGRKFGKHKMAPEISPAKSWEGFFGGFLGAAIILALFVAFSNLTINVFVIAPLVIIVSVFGPIGDLSESKIKRFAGKKDSSNLLPGHGGFFDRFDSVILVFPAVLFYFQIIKALGLI